MNKNVLMLTKFPPHVGGVSTHSYNLIKNSEDIQYHIITYDHENREDSDLHNVNLHYVSNLNFFGGRGLTYTLLAFMKGLMLSKKINFDLIHSQYAGPPSMAASLLKNTLSVPLVTTVHGSDQNLIPHEPVKNSLKNSNKIITVSKFLNKFVRNKLPGKEVESIYNGVSKTFKDMKLNNREYITFVGELSPHKGIKEFISLSKSLDENFLVIGDGVLREEIENKSKDNVEFTGYKKPNEVSRLLNQSKALVLPSHREGFGITLIEAMKCGTPVIGRNIQGISEIIKENKNGLLFDTEAELKSKLKKLINNQKLSKKLSKNGKKYSENYSWQKTADKTNEIYNSILNERE